MLPLLWRHYCFLFLRQLLATLLGLMLFLLLLRAEEIARYASLGASGKDILQLSLLLIPHSLPLSLPLATLLAASFVTRKISTSGELLSLLTSGVAPWSIWMPWIALSLLLGLFNGWCASEWASASHRAVRKLKMKSSLFSPDRFLSEQPLLHLGGKLILTTPKEPRAHSSSTTHALPSRSLYAISKGERNWNIYQVEELNLQHEGQIQGRNATLLALQHPPAEAVENPTTQLLLEHSDTITLPAKTLPISARQSITTYSDDQLNLTLLFSKIQRAISSPLDSDHKQEPKLLIELLHEVARRLFFLFSPIATMMIGIASGISLERSTSTSGIGGLSAGARSKLRALFLLFFLIASYFTVLHSPPTGILSLFPLHNLPSQTLPSLLPLSSALASFLAFLLPILVTTLLCIPPLSRPRTS